VHGHDGLDEITTTTKTDIVVLENGKITENTISPEDFGLELAHPEDLKGGDADENAQALLNIFNGEKNAYRDITLANTAAVLMMHNKVDDLKSGVKMGADIIDSGKAQEVLIRYIAFSQEVKKENLS
jgi:anthranilate phosphoribosyltransferase